MPNKRENYLEWQEYFMSIAFLSAQRSKDPRTQVGACIVNNQNKIVGIGYNGMPMGCHDDKMPWNRAIDKSTDNWLNSKAPYVCHAELNAVLNKNLADLTDCKIYVALFPCNMCAQIIVQSGIREVFFYSDKYHDQPHMIASRHLLDMACVKYSQFKPRQKKVVIDFDLIEESTQCQDPVLNDSITSFNGGLTMNNNTEAVNNNNKGAEKTSSFTNHAEMQNLHPNLQQQVQGMFQNSGGEESPSSLGVEQLKFSLLSIVFLVSVVFVSWLISQF